MAFDCVDNELDETRRIDECVRVDVNNMELLIEKDGEESFSATPPLDLIKFVISRQATKPAGGRERKTLCIDVNKARSISKCAQDVYAKLPNEAEVEKDGKLIN